jgi:uncharacterized membrane protein YkoI
MYVVTTRRTLLSALALWPLSTGLARANSDDEKDRNLASQALQQGKVRPLAEILDKVRAQLGGEVIGLKFKEKDGRYIYKLKVVTPSGQLRKVSVDATTGAIVKSKDD